MASIYAEKATEPLVKRGLEEDIIDTTRVVAEKFGEDTIDSKDPFFMAADELMVQI